MIHQLCETYGWSYEEAMKRTLPQIIMLTHSSHIAHKRMENKMEADRKTREKKAKKEEQCPVVFRGKRLSEMSSEEMETYYGGFSAESFGV